MQNFIAEGHSLLVNDMNVSLNGVKSDLYIQIKTKMETINAHESTGSCVAKWLAPSPFVVAKIGRFGLSMKHSNTAAETYTW